MPIAVVEQPRYSPKGKTKANNNALLVWIHKGPGRQDKRRPLVVFCCGNKAHYFKDGTCIHVKGLLMALKPWHRKRSRFVPFGDSEQYPEKRFVYDAEQ